MSSFQNPVSSFIQSALAKPSRASRRPMSAQVGHRKATNSVVRRYGDPNESNQQIEDDDHQKLSNSKLSAEEHEPIRKTQSRNSQRKLVSKTQNLKETINQLQQNPQNGDPLEDQKTRTIWRTFGSYIAKQLINGKGVVVPGFGVFTFSAAEVCLSGTTNPQNRDKQIREPVFMVAREFGANLKSGLYSQQDTLRPLELKGVSGVIPQVKANFAEISILCNESKEFCRESCDLVIKYFSGRAKKGEQLSVEIPMVGRFIVRQRVAAVSFADSLIQQTRGATAKTFTVGNIFGNSNATHNLNMGVTRSSLGGAIKINEKAESWLMNNLGINLNELPASDPASLGRRQKGFTRSNSMQQIISKSGVFNDERMSQASSQQTQAISRASRPMSAQGSHHTTAMASHMSVLPASDKFTLVSAAQKIFTNRQEISVAALKLKSNLREVIPSSKMLSILRQSGVNIDIITIKQLLNELGFPFNGPATSLTMFLTAIKALLHGQRQFEGRFMRQSDTASEVSRVTGYSGKNLFPGRVSTEDQKTINTIRDIFYTTQRNLFDLFKVGISGQTVDLDGFLRIVEEASGGAIQPQVSQAIFKLIARSNCLTFEVFEKTFRSEVPNSIEMETKVIRTVREWMFRSNLSAEMAFESFCRVVGNYKQKLLTRAQFHRALITLEVGLSAAQTDALFALLVSEATGQLDVNMWLSRIFEDGDNPLQMIREIVSEHKLTQEDLLFQMKLKAWDEPLSFSQLTQAIRSLDQSISDIQIRSMFTSLKNAVGLVPVMNLISNLTGKQFLTVDYKNKIQKQIYSEIFPKKEDEFLVACQELDKENNGIIHIRDLTNALKQVVTSVKGEDVERYVRFLEVDSLNKISYLKYIEELSTNVNRNHNAFRAIINRLAYFLQHNNVSPADLLARISQGNDAISVSKFAEFLKQKVDKKAELLQLQKLAARTDVDNDGKVCVADITTCIKNLTNGNFWKATSQKDQKNRTVTNFNPVEQKLSKERLIELIEKINEEMGNKKISYRDLFDKFDTDHDNMVSLAEFTLGITSMLSIAAPFAEQLYATMDKRGIGLINYNQFLDVIKSRKTDVQNVTDNFSWEYSVVEKIKQWVLAKNCTVEEAYKCFDRDFDGLVSKQDLTLSLKVLLEIPPAQLVDAKVDRLFRLLDTFKAGVVQLSDFQKIVGTGPVKSQQSDLLDWKSSAIQQIGLLLSKKFTSTTESFAVASGNSQKINFSTFVDFLKKNDLLHGFNLTNQLLEELFSQIDPHKKGFIATNDWKNAFQRFNFQDQKLEELKAALASAFVDYESAFNFFVTFGSSTSIINEACFRKAVTSITSELFNQSETTGLWRKLSEKEQMDIYLFRKHFGEIKFKGTQTVTSLKPLSATKRGAKSSQTSMMRTTITTMSSVTDQWEQNIVEKMRGIMKTSARPLQEIFSEFDVDGNGVVTAVEFRNAIRKLNLGLSSKEIDQLMIRIDANSDGMIDYNEFSSKFGTLNQQSQLMQERGKEKIAQLKELMTLHMNSVVDAFRYFDTTKNGTLAFSEFNALVQNCYQIAKLKPPTFPVVKDLFDLIDVRRDGELDITEWQQTFGRVTEGGNQLTIKPSPLSLWETSKEFANLCQALAKSRKHLIEKFRAVTDPKHTLFNFKQGKAALDDWLYQNFKGAVTDTHLKSVFSAAQVPAESQFEPQYDYMRLLDLYKARHLGPQQ